jgi:BRCA1-associated protein
MHLVLTLLQLETQRVWSYVEDAYVHRLIQSKADGKLVELPSASAAPPMRAGGSRDVAAQPPRERLGRAEESEKLEAMGAEYSFLLTSQLDTQRR